MKTLRDQTQEYWRVSQIFHGRNEGKLTTESALKNVGDIIDNLGPKRILRSRADELMSAIIQPRRRRKNKEACVVRTLNIATK